MYELKNELKDQFLIKFVGRDYYTSNYELCFSITHIKTQKEYKIILDNPSILDNIDNVIEKELYNILQSIRDERIDSLNIN
jgi:hypothetical protein